MLRCYISDVKAAHVHLYALLIMPCEILRIWELRFQVDAEPFTGDNFAVVTKLFCLFSTKEMNYICSILADAKGQCEVDKLRFVTLERTPGQ